MTKSDFFAIFIDMIQKFILPLVVVFFLLSPRVLKAETMTFAESFSSFSKINERASFVFVNLKQKEAVLPLQYNIKNLGKNLQNFSKNYITAIEADGFNLMVGGSAGALNLVSQDGLAEDLRGLLSGKEKRINAIGYAKENNFWLVGGEAKKTSEGALLFKLTPGGIKVQDLQSDAKALNIKTITDISCFESSCLISGTPKKLAFYDGNQLRDLSALEELKLNDPIRITNNDLVWLIISYSRDSNRSSKTPYRMEVYTFDGKIMTPVSLPDSAQSSSAPLMGASWGGKNWLLTRGSPDFAAWQIDGRPAEEITYKFMPFFEKARINPVVTSDSKNWFIGAGNRAKIIAAQGNNYLVDLTAMIPELKAVNLFSAVKSPWGGVVLAGSSLGAPFLYNLELGNYASSAALESEKIADTGSRIIKKAKIDYEAEIPPGTGIDFMLSVKDNGWESFEPGREKEFRNHGSSLRWRAVFYTNNPAVTPRLKKITITYEAEKPETPALIKSRDTQRLNDIKKIAAAVEKFKKSRGVYPVVEAPDSFSRWRQLEDLLTNGEFITKMPGDPLKEKDTLMQYDYFSTSNGSHYILLARLEDRQNKSLEKDLDDTPLQIFYASYSCDDPVYCEGNVPPAQPRPTPSPVPSPLPRGKVEIQLMRDPNGKIWRLVNNKKMYISSPALLEELKKAGYFWKQIKNLTKNAIEKYPTANLLKIKGQSDIYYLTESGQKRRIPNWQAFIDYGYKLTDVAEVSLQELMAINDSYLIKLQGDARVWKLEGDIKRHIPSPDVFKAYGFKWQDIAEVNWSEFNAFFEGEPLK